MNIEVREVGPRRAVCVVHKGPYSMIGSAFGRIAQWVKSHGVDAREGIGLYYDDPSKVAPEELRAHAGQLVPEDFTTDDPNVEIVDIPAGLFAVTTHMGPYDDLMGAWMEFHGQWMPRSGYEYGPVAPHEVYVNDCAEVPPEEVRTDLYLSLRKP